MTHVNRSRAEAAAEDLAVELQGLTSEKISAAYRKQAVDCHPDTAMGDQAQFYVIGQAKATLLAWLEALERARGPATAAKGNCRACAGLGRIQRRTGFNGAGLAMQCVLCAGTGNAKVADRHE